MIETKVITISIDLTPVEMYNKDLVGLYMIKLTAKYVGRCYKSMKILSIDKIISHSNVKMYYTLPGGGGQSDVEFQVSGIIYNKGEIIHGCKVTDVNPSLITARCEHVATTICSGGNPDKETILNILTQGSIIPLVVERAAYTIYASEISAVTTPYVPTVTKPVIYIIDRLFNADEMKKFGEMTGKIAVEEAKHKAIESTPSYKMFKSLLYPYKAETSFGDTVYVKTLGVKESTINDEEPASIIIHTCIDHPATKRCWHGNYSSVVGGMIAKFEVSKGSYYTAFCDMSNKYLMYLLALRGMVETYTPELAKETKTYFGMCMKYKTDKVEL